MRSQLFVPQPEAEKVIVQTVARQLLDNPGDVDVQSESHYDRGWLTVEGDSLQPEFLQLNNKDICSIIAGRTLALLKCFYYGHEFVVIAHYHALPHLSTVQIEIHIDALI